MPCGSKVVWARDMGRAGNQELIDYFKGRHVWLLEPDARPPKLLPYSGSPPGGCAVQVSGSS